MNNNGIYSKASGRTKALTLFRETLLKTDRRAAAMSPYSFLKLLENEMSDKPKAGNITKEWRETLVGLQAIEASDRIDIRKVSNEYARLVKKFVDSIQTRTMNAHDEIVFRKEIENEIRENKGHLRFLFEIQSGKGTDIVPLFLFDVGRALGAQVEIAFIANGVTVRLDDSIYDRKIDGMRIMGDAELKQVVSSRDIQRIKALLLVLAGNELMGAKEFERAFDLYIGAIQHDNTCANAHNGAGNALQSMGKPEKAILHYKKAASLAEVGILRSRYFYNLASARKEAGGAKNVLEAMDDCGRALRLAPGFAEAYVLRSSLHRANNDLGAALEDCNRAVLISPSLASAYQERAIINDALGMYADASKDMRRYEELTGGRGAQGKGNP